MKRLTMTRLCTIADTILSIAGTFSEAQLDENKDALLRFFEPIAATLSAIKTDNFVTSDWADSREYFFTWGDRSAAGGALLEAQQTIEDLQEACSIENIAKVNRALVTMYDTLYVAVKKRISGVYLLGENSDSIKYSEEAEEPQVSYYIAKAMASKVGVAVRYAELKFKLGTEEALWLYAKGIADLKAKCDLVISVDGPESTLVYREDRAVGSVVSVRLAEGESICASPLNLRSVHDKLRYLDSLCHGEPETQPLTELHL